MIDAISGWVRDLAVTALILAFAEMLLPRNDLRKFARVVIGLVLVAIILGSLVDLSSVDLSSADLLGTASNPHPPGAPGTGEHDYAAAGNRIAQAGLEIAGRDVRTLLERQVESLARLASGAEVVDARVDLGPSGDLLGVRVTVRVTWTRWQARSSGQEHGDDQGQGQGQREGQGNGQERGDSAGSAEDRAGLDTEGVPQAALAARVERAIRDFYGLAGNIPVVVEVLG